MARSLPDQMGLPIGIMGSVALPIFFSLLLCSNFPLYSQDSIRTRQIIDLRFGVNQVREENLHAKTSSGTITELSYGFESRKNRWQQFHFTLGYSRLKTELEDLSKTANLKLNLGYSYSYELFRKNRFSYYLGPQAKLAYSATYFPNWDDSHLYWADYLSVGVRNNFALVLKNQNEWVASMSVPLFSVFSRPDLYRLYKIDDVSIGGIASNLNSSITPAHLTNVFFFSLQNEYRFRVFKTKTQAFTYSFDYLRVKHNGSNTFQQISHQFGIKIFL